MTTMPQVIRPKLTPTPSRASTDRYLRSIFNHYTLSVSGIAVREVQYIDRYASRAAVLTEAQRLGWSVFVTGSRWLIIPKNRAMHQFKWQLATVQ